MKALLSIRTSSLNNDYRELIEDDSSVFNPTPFRSARDRAYNRAGSSRVSLFVLRDGEKIFFGGWLNVADYAGRNILDDKFAYTNRSGENATMCCISFAVSAAELKKVTDVREISVSETTLLELFKKYVTDEIWDAERGENKTYPSVSVDIPEDKEGYLKPYYEKLYDCGMNGGVLSVLRPNQAFIIQNAMINNLIRWNAENYEAYVCAPSGVAQDVNVRDLYYLNPREPKRRIAFKLRRYCSNRGYDFEKNALIEIAEASRFNFPSAREILDYVAGKTGGKNVTAEMCIRLMDSNRVGYNGLMAEDLCALKLIGAGLPIAKIAAALNVDEIRFNNQIASFLLFGKYAASDGKKLSLTKRGQAVLSSEAIREFVGADDVGDIDGKVRRYIEAENCKDKLKTEPEKKSDEPEKELVAEEKKEGDFQ